MSDLVSENNDLHIVVARETEPDIELLPTTVFKDGIALFDGSRFTRSKDGGTVHFAHCPVRGVRVPWRWADDKTDRQVAYQILNTAWLKPCRICCGKLRDAL